MTRRTDDTDTEATGTTETTMTVTGVNRDAAAMKMRKGDHTDIAQAVTERGHALAHDHHTNALTTETAMTTATDLVATETVVHLARVLLAGVVRRTITRSAASPILVQSDPDLPGQNPDHRTGHGETITADNKDDDHLPTSVPATDNQNRIARRPGRRGVTKQQSKQSARSGWQLCNRMLRNWKSIVERDLRILMREMQSSAKRMIARDPTRPISSAAYAKKPKVSTLEGGCKVDEVAVMMIEQSAAASLWEERTCVYTPVMSQ